MPESKDITSELVALIHHIELDKAGWWEKALQKLALTVFHLKSDQPTLDASEIAKALEESFRIEIPVSDISSQLDVLREDGQILEVAKGRFKISESTLRKCQSEIEDATKLEEEVQACFAEQLAKFCPLIDSDFAWKQFIERFLIPVVQQLGASTYELITGLRSTDNLTQINDFLRCFHSEYELDLTSFLRNFLNPSDAIIRRYVLRTMNAFFVVKAGGLSRKTIDRLSASNVFSATLFFDSNVLFSLLGLHDNPANQGSRTLLDLVRKLSNSVPIKLRVLPPTLDEMTRAIKASQEALLNIKISPTLLQPALNLGMTGITARYLQAAAEHNGPLAPSDYFEPYLKNLLTILRTRGVEIFNVDLSSYGTNQEVIDDIIECQKFEKQRQVIHPKSYEQLRHDIVLWHFVKNKRPPRPESPIDAEFWIATADFRFLGFDAYKQRGISGDVPICIYPAALVQLLRFWVPLDEEFEKALFSAIRLPAVMAPVDTDAERISLKILNALSTFENIADLPEEAVTRILLNDALRLKIATEKDVSRQIELVREALIDENRAAEGRIQAEKARSLLIQQHSRAIETQLDERSRKVEELEARLKDQSNLTQQKDEELARLTRASEERASRTRFLMLSGLALIVAGGLGYLVHILIVDKTYLVTIDGCLLAAWFFGIRILGAKSRHISGWGWYKKFARAYLATVAALLLTMIGNALWAWLSKK